MGVKKILCYTAQQQAQYEALNEKQRLFVDLVSAGINEKDAYIQCGYSEKSAIRGVQVILSRNNIRELIDVRKRARYLSGLNQKDSPISNDIDKKAQDNHALQVQDEAEKTLDFLENANALDMERVKFYKDIINGTTVSNKETIYYKPDGSVKARKVEKITDVNAMMEAREQLDKIMGINRLQEVGKVVAGANITVKIVKAGNLEELSDSRNTVNLGYDLTEESEEIERQQKLESEENE